MSGADKDVETALAESRDYIVESVTRFVNSLRRRGVTVPVSATIQGVRSLTVVGLNDRHEVYVALRATLVSREEDLSPFDDLFPTFWQYLQSGPHEETVNESEGGNDDSEQNKLPALRAELPSTEQQDTTSEADTDVSETKYLQPATGHRVPKESEVESTNTASTYSPQGGQDEVSVSMQHTDDREIRQALDTLAATFISPPGRRTRPNVAGQRVDARRALRRSVNTGGAITSLPRQSPVDATVRAVVLVDVSRSVLDAVDREFLIRFLRLATATWEYVRTFFFDTNIEEVTQSFEADSPAETTAALQEAETKWGGGTQIGDAVMTISASYPDAVDRRTAVIIVSDGLEVGDTGGLEKGMAWLSRRAKLVTWWNPLAGAANYEPTCRGMQAALPFVDSMFTFRTAEDLSEIAYQFQTYGVGGQIGYEHDSRRQ